MGPQLTSRRYTSRSRSRRLHLRFSLSQRKDMDVSPIGVTSSENALKARPRTPSQSVARWIVAVMAVTYGFAKLNEAQFTVLDSELDKPMGSVSGFWLTWYYFGYSAVYGGLLAALQIIGGLLVTQPRFALTGALLLLPMVTNIVLVDIFYGVDLGGTLSAAVLLSLLAWIVAPHVRRLFDAVVPSGGGSSGAMHAFGAPLALIVAAFGSTYWVANYNNRAPTAVDGVWETQVTAGVGELERVFFERNRAHMVVLKDTSGNYRRHHFELEPDGRLRIWDEWLDKGALLFEGDYTPPNLIRLHRADEYGGGVVEIRRENP